MHWITTTKIIKIFNGIEQTVKGKAIFSNNCLHNRKTFGKDIY